MKVILDKSFIQGTPKEDFHYFLQNYECYLPESIFFELLTTTPQKRISSFSKLIQITSPVKLVKNVGAFLRYEWKNKKPCLLTDVLATKENFVFNENLIRDDFQMSESQSNDLKEWQVQISSDINEFVKFVNCLPRLFPEIGKFQPGQKESVLDQIEIDIAEENFLFDVFKELTTDKFPRPPILNISWATVRWMQIEISAAIKFIKAYGINPHLETNKKIRNLFLDFNHLLPAVQGEGIATKDIWVKETLKRIKKDAVILPND